VSVRARQDVLDQGGVILFASCEEACTLTASGTVSVPAGVSKVLKFKRISRSVPANTRAKLRLRLSRNALRVVMRALGRRKKLTSRVTLRATDLSGNSRSVKRRIKLKR
jgi:hypothetical protein